jgi:hypothetical protein
MDANCSGLQPSRLLRGSRWNGCAEQHRKDSESRKKRLADPGCIEGAHFV